MSPSISTSYVIPAVLLNPILFLHSLNALLARILPPIIIDPSTVQPPSYYPLGPSSEHPHLDIHASDGLCWSYTIVMVCAQLVAFERVSMRREERRERARKRKEKGGVSKTHFMKEVEVGNGHAREGGADNSLLMNKFASAVAMNGNGKVKGEEDSSGDSYDGSENSFLDSTDSEVIL